MNMHHVSFLVGLGCLALGCTAVTWGGDDEARTLTFDAVSRSYAGPLGSATLVLQGDHEEAFDREIWKYREIFTGSHEAGSYQGSWTYTECDFTVEPENCPANGGCEGLADSLITVPPEK